MYVTYVYIYIYVCSMYTPRIHCFHSLGWHPVRFETDSVWGSGKKKGANSSIQSSNWRCVSHLYQVYIAA